MVAFPLCRGGEAPPPHARMPPLSRDSSSAYDPGSCEAPNLSPNQQHLNPQTGKLPGRRCCSLSQLALQAIGFLSPNARPCSGLNQSRAIGVKPVLGSGLLLIHQGRLCRCSWTRTRADRRWDMQCYIARRGLGARDGRPHVARWR